MSKDIKSGIVIMLLLLLIVAGIYWYYFIRPSKHEKLCYEAAKLDCGKWKHPLRIQTCIGRYMNKCNI